MEWKRGEMIGKGSFGSVYLATPRNQTSPLMAVKSAPVSQASLLQKEKEILSKLSDCRQIIGCFGEDYTVENGERFYNLRLEYAARGNIRQVMKNSGGVLSETNVKHYTKSILLGLQRIHEKGFVHCDIKLQNILLCNGSDEIKIADFGFAKKAGEMQNKEADGVFGLRGTPLYMSPESISGNEQEAATDIWAIGCIVAEMITGRPAWNCRPDADVSALLFRIGFSEEVPEIPNELSEEGKDFLRKCFVRDPTKRWSAEMLLNHPFVHCNTVALPDCEQRYRSPRSPFGFPDWSSKECSCSESFECFGSGFDELNCPSSATTAPSDRICQLATGKNLSGSFTDTWMTVRQAESCVSKTRDALRER